MYFKPIVIEIYPYNVIIITHRDSQSVYGPVTSRSDMVHIHSPPLATNALIDSAGESESQPEEHRHKHNGIFAFLQMHCISSDCTAPDLWILVI